MCAVNIYIIIWIESRSTDKWLSLFQWLNNDNLQYFGSLFVYNENCTWVILYMIYITFYILIIQPLKNQTKITF